MNNQIILTLYLRIGGDIVGMTWDSRGRHLAVSFVNSDVIAVFITNIAPKIHLSRW